MKKSFLAFLFCLAFTALFAQKSSADKAAYASGKMAKNLDLTEQQRSDVQAAYTEMYDAYAILKTNDKTDKSLDRTSIRSNFDSKIKSILTPDQFKKMEGGKSKMKRDNTERQKNVGKKNQKDPEERANLSAERTAERLSKQLNLTDDQKKKVYEAHKKKTLTSFALRPKMQTDREEAVAERRKSNQEYKDAIDSILTDEQKEKRKSMRQNRMSRPQGAAGSGQGSMSPGESRPIEDKAKIQGEFKEETDIDRKAAAFTKKMVDKLNLTKEQSSSFQLAYLKRLKMVDGLNKADVEMDDKKKAKQAIMDEYNTKLASFLTQEQLQKMEAIKYNRGRN